MLIVQLDDDRRGIDAVTPSNCDLPAVPLQVGEDLVGDDVLILAREGDQFRGDDLDAVGHMRRMNVVVGIKGGRLEVVVGRRIVVAAVLYEIIAVSDWRIVGNTNGVEIRPCLGRALCAVDYLAVVGVRFHRDRFVPLRSIRVVYRVTFWWGSVEFRRGFGSSRR